MRWINSCKKTQFHFFLNCTLQSYEDTNSYRFNLLFYEKFNEYFTGRVRKHFTRFHILCQINYAIFHKLLILCDESTLILLHIYLKN